MEEEAKKRVSELEEETSKVRQRYEKQLLNQEERNIDLTMTIKEKTEMIEKFSNTVKERDDIIRNQETKVKERDEFIRNQESKIKELTDQIMYNQQVLNRLTWLLAHCAKHRLTQDFFGALFQNYNHKIGVGETLNFSENFLRISKNSLSLSERLEDIFPINTLIFTLESVVK